MSEPALQPAPPRRAVCERCLRPQSACICGWVTPVACAAEVLILQHPLEVANPKGSARLLHLSLPHSRLVVGETFGEDALHDMLQAPWGESGGATPRQPLLLYPESGSDPVLGGGMALADDPLLRAPARLRLVVLDATWRKSRKMLYLNRRLQDLPRLALADVPASRYLIRKAHRPHQLSTLEATCLALRRLEGTVPDFEPLLQAFDGFIGQQLGYRSR